MSINKIPFCKLVCSNVTISSHGLSRVTEEALTLKISSSEAAETASFMALSNSSSAVKSPEIARRISGPISCKVRSPAWKEYSTEYWKVTEIKVDCWIFVMCALWGREGAACEDDLQIANDAKGCEPYIAL